MNEPRLHKWVLLGSFEIPLDQSETRRIVHTPDDAAVSWRRRAKLVGVHGPGCSACGQHAKEALGTVCPGEQTAES